MEELRAWLGVLGGLVALAGFLYMVSRDRGGARRAEIIALGVRIDELEARIAADTHSGDVTRSELRERLIKIEEQLGHMPDISSMYRTEITVSEVRADQKIQNATMVSLAQAIRRLEDHLLGVVRSPGE